MADEITLEFVLNSINRRIDGLETSIKEYRGEFVRFEEGKLTQALQDIQKSKGDILLLQQQNTRQDDINVKNSERRKDWIWGAAEKIIFALLGVGFVLLGIILQNLHILNLKPG